MTIMPIDKPKKNIINAHTHVFTGNFVPPYLARTFVPWPFYYLVHTGWIIKQFKRHFKNKYKKDFALAKTEEERAKLWKEIYSGRRKERAKVKRNFYISSRVYLNLPYRLIIFWLSALATLYFIEGLAYLFNMTIDLVPWWDIRDKLEPFYLYFNFSIIFKIGWILGVVLFVRQGRKYMWLVLKKTFPFLKKLFNKRYKDMIDRYVLMGRFAFYESQEIVARRALHQLPPYSSIVMLPMDMENMGAGKSKMTKVMKDSKAKKITKKNWEEKDFTDTYKYQMRELWEFAKNSDKSGPRDKYYPFVFVDARRAADEGKAFFDYEIVNDKMVLEPCFIKTYMEDRQFSGFKIYPAIGYYPFDEHLLPIWRYASENNIPIMTHCIEGTIFYRGPKKKDWNFHPVFQQEYNQGQYEPMLLPQSKNFEFQINFTHPLNYLCLVEEDLFKRLLDTAYKDSPVRDLFYDKETGVFTHRLSNLKICLAHYGGEVEWTRYMEQDRENSSQRLMRDPKEAVKFMENSDGDFSWYKLNDLWHKADWYSIISSMLIEYENIYADLSYIISKPSIYPLLKYTLEKGDNYDEEHANYLAEPLVNKKAMHYTGKNKLRSRVLFGTDFYVVRNHKSDKELFIETKALLDEENFDLIASENTHNYLSRH